MFYQNSDYEKQLDRAESGAFPLIRAELQPAIDAASEVETTWWESDRLNEFADRQDERIRAVTGTEFAYPREAQLRKLGQGSEYIAALVGDTQALELNPDTAITEYNNDIRRLREVHSELSDLKTTEEAEFEWLQHAQDLRREAARQKRHSGDGFTDSASLAELWAGVKHGVQEPANIAAIGASVTTGLAMAPALASSSLFLRLGAPVLMDSLYGAAGQYSISDRLEDLRLRLGYTPEQVKEMKWEETATAFGMSAVLGGLFETGSLGVRKLLRGSGKLGEAIDNLNSPDAAVRAKAADEIEVMVPLNDNELDLLRDVRRDAMLRATAPVEVKTEANLRAYLDKLKGAEQVADGGPMPKNWFERLNTYYDPDAPRLAVASDLVAKADAGGGLTLDDIRPALAPDQARRFEQELAQTPKATTERVTLFDVRDLSNEGKKLFRQIEAFSDKASRVGELPEDLARDRAFLLASIEAGADKDRLAWVRDRIINNELDQIKKRVQEVRQITDRTDLLNKWVQELRGELATVQMRRQLEAGRPDIVRGANVLSADAINRARFGAMRGVALESMFPDRPVATRVHADTPEGVKAQFENLQARPVVNEADLKLDESLAGGKYDKVIEESRADLVERFGSKSFVDPDTGETMTVADFIQGRDATLAGLDDILACMMKNVK